MALVQRRRQFPHRQGRAAVREAIPINASVIDVENVVRRQPVAGFGRHAQAAHAESKVIEIGAHLCRLRPVVVRHLGDRPPRAGHGQSFHCRLFVDFRATGQAPDLFRALHHANHANQVGAVLERGPRKRPPDQLIRLRRQALHLQADARLRQPAPVQDAEQRVGRRGVVVRSAEERLETEQGLWQLARGQRVVQAGTAENVQVLHPQRLRVDGEEGIDDQGRLALQRKDGIGLAQVGGSPRDHHVLFEKRVDPAVVVGEIGYVDRRCRNQDIQPVLPHILYGAGAIEKHSPLSFTVTFTIATFTAVAFTAARGSILKDPARNPAPTVPGARRGSRRKEA